jgi:hypothetical protein
MYIVIHKKIGLTGQENHAVRSTCTPLLKKKLYLLVYIYSDSFQESIIVHITTIADLAVKMTTLCHSQLYPPSQGL